MSKLIHYVALLLALGATSLAAAERPNVVFFFIDDLGWSDLGFMGSDFYETPHIDRLAADGMVFTDAYANAPNCARRGTASTQSAIPNAAITTCAGLNRPRTKPCLRTIL
jgi:arylsulfatase A-like enzyme